MADDFLGWEAPPTFADGILSASKLRSLSSDTDFLTGRANGPKAVFSGVLLEEDTGNSGVKDPWEDSWDGYIRHYEDSLRHVVWMWANGDPNPGDGTIDYRIYIADDDDPETADNLIFTNGPVSETEFTEYTAATDISGENLTVGVWYAIRVQAQRQGSFSTSNNDVGFHLAMLREEAIISRAWVLPFTSGSVAFDVDDTPETITGAIGGAIGTAKRFYLTSGTWGGGDAAGRLHLTDVVGDFQAEDLNGSTGGGNIATSSGAGTGTPAFSDTEANLTSKLNQLSDNLSAFKTVADMPDAAMAGVDYEAETTHKDLHWDDGKHYGGGFQFPGANATLVYQLEAIGDSSMKIEIYVKTGNGAFADPGDIIAPGEINIPINSVVEGEINISGLGASAGDWGRIKITADRQEGTQGGAKVRIWNMAVRDDEAVTAVEYWTHGRGLENDDLNTLAGRLDALNPTPASPDANAKLSQWWNQAVKTIGEVGFRIYILRRKGFRYLHYRTYSGDLSNPQLKYWGPGSADIQNYALDKFDGYWTLVYTSGSTEFTVGETITGDIGGATGIVVSYVLAGGTWGGGDANGTVYIKDKKGDFEAEDLDGSDGPTVDMATIPGAGSGAGFQTLDLEQLGNILTPGVPYSLDDIDVGQEWDSD